MGRRSLKIELISTKSLTKQNPSGSAMVDHAGAYITNNSAHVQYTSADHVGDANPTWKHPLNFTLRCSSGGTKSCESLHIDLCNKMPNGSSCVVGSSEIPLVNLLASAGKEAMASVNYSCTVSTGGWLYLSYSLGAYVSRARKIGASIGLVTLAGTVEGVIGAGINKLEDLFTGDGDDNESTN